MTTFLGTDFNNDPFPLLDRLRQTGRVHRVAFPDGLGVDRWMLTHYDDIAAALDDPRLSNELGRGLPDLIGDGPVSLTMQAQIRTNELLGSALGNVDPPRHTRLRKLVVRAFSARRIDAFRPRVQQITDQLLDAVADRDEFDLMESVASQLPIRAVCELLGVPPEGGDICRDAATILGGLVPDDNAAAAIIASIDAFDAFARDLIAARRAQPADDVITDLATAEVDGERLTDDELVAMCGFVLFAGHETTVQLICNGMLALLLHPDQMARLRSDLTLLPSTVEEILRYDGPVNPGLPRYVLEDIEIDGQTIPRGAYVVLATASANRDPARWDHPESFNVAREFPDPQLSFGQGLHYCLGARLARTEGEIALGTLLQRYPTIELAVDPTELKWRESFIRSLHTLPLRVG